MSDSGTSSTDEQRRKFAEEFGREVDPLAKYEGTFQKIDADPFGLFRSEILEANDYAEGTRVDYRRLIGQWRTHMADAGRHPACPTEQHVRSFADYCLHDLGNQSDTVGTKLRRLGNIYAYWQEDAVFPHPPEYNPFASVLSKLELRRSDVKEPPRIPIPELRETLADVTAIRDWLIIAVQLKLGLRASEVCNLHLQDVNIENGELNDFYGTLGTQSGVADRLNAVYIATREERDGNKSRNPRVLPLDEELQTALVKYLLIRPDTGAPWIFLSQTTHSHMAGEQVNRLWKAVFRPAYDETETHRAVTSHFGRHRFSTYWRVEQDLNRELVQYMRGDTPQDASDGYREAIDHYLHTYYEDIESLYRQEIFSLIE